jgi:8-oxo-dGTP diphosphatase
MIRLVKLITEKRSHADKNVKKSVLDQLEKYKDDPSYFVSFTNIEKIGINPVNKFSTPTGVYSYNLKDLWNDWVDGDDFFGKDRPYVNLIKLDTDKVLDMDSYKLNKKDLTFLKKKYDEHKKNDLSFSDWIKKIKSNNSKDTLYKVKTDGGLMWKATEELSKLIKNDDKNNTTAWNGLIRDMGYETVVDKKSTIHLLQSSQAVFLTPKAYDVVDRYENKTYDRKTDNKDKKKIDDYWGTDKQPFHRPGVNPTVDLVVKYNDGKNKKILLIKRGENSKAEAGKWALPGGFHDSNEPIGKPWKPGRETAEQAAIRELTEETGLYIANVKDLASRMKKVGVYEGGGRDPRDNKEAWSKSTTFTIELTPEDGVKFDSVSGKDDAQDAKWFDEDKLPELAFDHKKIINKALKIKTSPEPKKSSDKETKKDIFGNDVKDAKKIDIKDIPKKDLEKKIKNPDTDKMIKVQSALNYDDSKKVYQAALNMLKKNKK